MYDQAKAIYAQALGKNHIDYAIILNNQSVLYVSRGHYKQAISSLQEAIDIIAQVKGKTYLDYAVLVGNLAFLYQYTGQYMQSLLLHKKSFSIKQKLVPITHPTYYDNLNALTWLYQAMNQPQAVASVLNQSAAIYRQRILKDIAILDANTLGQYQQTFNTASLLYSMVHWSPDAELAGASYNQALLDKGARLLATQQLERLLQQHPNLAVKNLAKRRQQLRKQLEHLYNTDTSSDKIAPLEAEVRDLQAYIVRLLPEYRQAFESIQIEWPQVQKALRPTEATVEFVSYAYYTWQLNTIGDQWTWQPGPADSTLYAAIVLRPGWKPPRMVHLGEERQFDSLLVARSASPEQINGLYRGGKAGEATASNWRGGGH